MVESETETIRYQLNKLLVMVGSGTETKEDQLDGDQETADVYSHMVDSEIETMEDQLYADVCSHMLDSGTKTMGNKHNKLHVMVDCRTESTGNKRNKLHGIVDRTETVEDQLSGDQETDDVYSHMVDSETETMEHQLYGDHETQVSEGGEADLHKHLIGCKKNPGHIKFIPVDTFTINHLPKGHRDNDLYEYIKVIAELSVRVDVKMTSPDRPEFWPNTNVPYPFYNMKDKTNLRTGSGMMSGVDKFTDGYNCVYGGKHRKNYTTCWCKQCQHSDTASHVWWEFNVDTATHVVFDDIEASHTSLRLFYDREESPVVSVDQVSVDYVNIESDTCVLKCVTCDKNLGDKLDMLCGHYVDVWRKVWNKYRESRDVDKLNFIVSHPHGCCKQVSVGHWVDKYKVDKSNEYKFTYTTCTCPGSSGATVHCVGYGDVGVLFYQLVHSGSLNSKLNYSGAGEVW